MHSELGSSIHRKRHDHETDIRTNAGLPNLFHQRRLSFCSSKPYYLLYVPKLRCF